MKISNYFTTNLMTSRQNWNLFTNLFYGAIVNQMLETSNTRTTSEQLRAIGKKIGPRMLEDYYAKNKIR